MTLSTSRILRKGGRNITKERITLLEYAPGIASELDPDENGGLTADQVSYASNKKVAWICAKGHHYKSAIYARTLGGASCPYCSHKLAIPGETDLATLFPDIAAEWDFFRNGSLKPHETLPSSNYKVWWVCEAGHEWAATIRNRTELNSGCPYCIGRKIYVTRLI